MRRKTRHMPRTHSTVGPRRASGSDTLRLRRPTSCVPPSEVEAAVLYSLRGIREAECKALSGDRTGARSQTGANWEISFNQAWSDNLCRCDALLARLLLPDSPGRAAHHLHDARAFANGSGNVEFQLCCFQAASEQYRHL